MMTDTIPVLQLRRVGRTHGRGAQRVDALIDVDLDVMPGEMVAITGRSGSGKSTLLNLAGGLDQPTTGSVHVDRANLGDLSTSQLATLRRQTVGYVFQEFNLLPTLRAVENVSLPLELDGQGIAASRRMAEDALVAVGLEDKGHRFPDELSGGEQQRVAIARGLVGPRRLLLADEPTGALDDVTAEGILRLMRRRCDEGAACLLVTHELSFAAWANRIVRLRDGMVETVTERSADPTTIAGVTA